MQSGTNLPSPAAAGVARRRIALLPPASLAGFLLAVAAVIFVAMFSFRSLDARTDSQVRVSQTLAVLDQLKVVQATLSDAETGQRGFLLSDKEEYLEPYARAKSVLPGQLRQLRRQVQGEATQEQRVDAIERLVAEKFREMDQTVALRRGDRDDAAMDVVRTDRGKATMDRIRDFLGEMEQDQRASLVARQAVWQEAAEFSISFTYGSSLLLLALIFGAAYTASRDFRLRETQAWIRAGQMGLASRLQGEQRLNVLGDAALQYLAQYLDAQAAALYVAEPEGGFRRVAGYAVGAGQRDETLRQGEGLLGQAAREQRTLHVRELPDGYLEVSSTLGRGKARELVAAPAVADGYTYAVIELAFFRKVDSAGLELLARLSETLAIAVRTSRDRSQLEDLLEETQRQAEEMQTQQEELRVSNEELEVQSRSLKESQLRLETQQEELEQSNSQLEEQTRQLEAQKDELLHAQGQLTAKAEELERSNQYKSEFLANMSHELRTPLNSTLILAKLLADNKSGNLTGDQVRYAQTITSAGTDLLAIINDILDLSKIEAGKVEVAPETVAMARVVESLAASFEPVAHQRGLQFSISVDASAPGSIETDNLRLGQILKNLVSNALKFTSKGGVSIRIGAPEPDKVAFEVWDTGIGISADQIDVIFDAFRQADGSTHRKYGGTGLGLSIARELAALLGGSIAVRSTPGTGSVFTLTIPAAWAGPYVQRRETYAGSAGAHEDAVLAAPAAIGAGRVAPPAAAVADDRAALQADTRTMLVIEDDVRFAQILKELSQEMGFQCIVTHTAQAGLDAARQYRPSAILLDMNLPDFSGLGVLDQLKHDAATRHIPVHVISVLDYARAALERGAVGYALKPVKREELIEALKRLEQRFSQSLRRVLVVEDDTRQRDSIVALLQNGDVQITAVDTAGAALAQLQSITFDCVVMDLNLPDLSGYDLLSRMASMDGVSFPPVIVYTGRSLSAEEEQNLMKFSRSIIIKDARSPERLLDEVTLFIHQVESRLSPEGQAILKATRDRDAALEERRILVVEDDVRNIFALSSLLEPLGARIEIARNGVEALAALEKSKTRPQGAIDLVLMDIMMPEMDGLTCMREIRKQSAFKKLPIIALTAKAMKDDQEKCMAAGANDYIAKPLDTERLLSLIRVWMPK